MNIIQKTVKWYKRPKSKTADFFESLIVFIPIAFFIRTIGFGLYKVPTCSMETTILAGEGLFADKLTPLFKEFKHGDVISFNSPLYNYSKNPALNWWQMYVWGPENWTKRIIGLPGDHIQGKIENGKPIVYRNGQKLDEPYLNKYPIVLTVNPNRTWPSPFVHKTYDPQAPLDKQPFYRMNKDELALGKMIENKTGEPFLRYPGTPNSDKGLSNERKDAQVFDEYDIRLGPDEYWLMGDNRQGSTDSRAWGHLKRKFIHGKVLFRIWSHDDEDASWMILDLLKHPIDFWKRFRWSRCLNLIK